MTDIILDYPLAERPDPWGRMTAVLLLLKLVLAPLLVVLSSLAGRRWGPGLVGLLVALPVVVGPILLITALDQGRQFGSDAAAASLLGLLTLSVFAVVFARVSGVRGPVTALVVTWLVCLAVDLALSRVLLPPLIGVALALAGTGVAARLMPGTGPALAADLPGGRPWPPWDLPARALATVLLVVVVTGAAAQLGPSLTGVLAAFPVASSVVAAFTLALRGHPATVMLLRGLLHGLVGVSTFCFLVATLVVPLGPAVAFTGALGAAIVAQLAIRWAGRHP